MKKTIVLSLLLAIGSSMLAMENEPSFIPASGALPPLYPYYEQQPVVVSNLVKLKGRKYIVRFRSSDDIMKEKYSNKPYHFKPDTLVVKNGITYRVDSCNNNGLSLVNDEDGEVIHYVDPNSPSISKIIDQQNQ